jgi:ketosteroid isomerase-like protein
VLAVGLTLVSGCGHRVAGRAPASAGSTAADVQTVGWMVGRWQRPEGVEHWTAAGGVLWGVGFSTREGQTALFEVLLIEAADGGLRYVAMPNGKPEVAFAAVSAGADGAAFSNPAHDFPKVIRYRRDGEALFARVEGDGGEGEDYRWQAAGPGRAEPLESADRAFAADTARRGIEGWMAAFDPAGAMWNRSRKANLSGEAIRETMAPLFARGVQIAWEPVASGLSPAGDLGYTVGTSRFTAPDSKGVRVETHRGSYVTIWRRQPDGSWKVLFDTGS